MADRAQRARGFLDRRGPAVEVVERTGSTTVARTVVDPADPVFAGHYPGFPILPGVSLVEFAHRAAHATLPGPDGAAARWAAVEQARFLAPVPPGAELTARLEWRPGADASTLRCDVAIAGPEGPVARVRLRYEVGHGSTERTTT
ncbi:3-hydroxyacyl-[acyl-carrier-protein] dehydratase [Saccharothrix saharensis]|uniref:3-hydroxyacyl-[acyl-carrier-protein] dehydratase n=1 Tax=Saccharothrix saharensis TaxID=571190 RepID=A0A543J6E1_9PSEU|nr:beta-hydroxyacyl-ACP dehydratase [Saccharothrix saharensis]TQM78409.1 3-hydroxyacyl-[acyl-carrier-protein] dehydratase [Saccharothrix saharensis]